MSEPSLYRCTPRQVRSFVLDCMYAGLVPFIQSSPGMGKSAITRSIAKEQSLFMIDHRLSTSAPEDLSGLPRFTPEGRATFAPFDMFPIEGMDIPAGYQGWMLFLDEFNSAPKSVQAAAYKLILDRMIGQARLHPNVAVVAAGNLSTDRAITNALSTAMQSRVIHIEMEINHREWLEDVAYVEKYDDRIIAFLNWKEGYLMDFRPDHNEKTFCCPRTWEFVNKLIHDQPVQDEKTPLLAGAITSGVAVEFVQFCQIYKDLLQIDDVIRDPTGVPVPSGADRRWAVVSHLMAKVDDKTFGDVCRFINRMDLSFRVLFYRGLLIQQPALRSHPEFANAMVEVTKYLHEDK
jgi:hypothetical protein